MIGSKQPAATPAAANRPLARSSLARGRGINSSRQTEKNRQEGVGRKGKREPSHPLIFALFHEMDDIDHPLPSSYHSVGNSSRKQAVKAKRAGRGEAGETASPPRLSHVD